MKTEKGAFTAADFRQRALMHALPLSLAGNVDGARHSYGDHDLNPELLTASMAQDKSRLAAVLVPVVDRGAAANVILTKRAAHLSTHAGQIAFPGGKVAGGDADVIAAALRETAEEIGVLPEYIEPVGLLETYRTGTGFRVVPVLAVIAPGFTLTVDAQEVADVFEVPLAFLMTPDNHQRHSVEFFGQNRQYHAIPYEKHYIWGATAGILRIMYERLYSE